METRERFSYLFDDSTWGVPSGTWAEAHTQHIVREMEELVKHINNNNSIEYLN